MEWNGDGIGMMSLVAMWSNASKHVGKIYDFRLFPDGKNCCLLYRIEVTVSSGR